jgi:hypothetical protein
MEQEPTIAQSELPGMPEKDEATLIAERILDLKEDMAELRNHLAGEKIKFVNEMRLKQKSHIIVNGFEFDVELADKVTIKKTKKKAI